MYLIPWLDTAIYLYTHTSSTYGNCHLGGMGLRAATAIQCLKAIGNY